MYLNNPRPQDEEEKAQSDGGHAEQICLPSRGRRRSPSQKQPEMRLMTMEDLSARREGGTERASERELRVG